MPDKNTVLAGWFGPHPNDARAIHAQRQAALPESARADDPSAPHRVVARGRARDQIVRGRVEFRTGGDDA